MLGQCWADVVDGGPTLSQHWFDVSCLLGRPYVALLLGQRCRRLANLKTTLGLVLCFPGRDPACAREDKFRHNITIKAIPHASR